MAKKDYKNYIGDKVLCPNCCTNLLNSSIKLRSVTKEESCYNIIVEEGDFKDKEFYDRNTIEEIHEEYFCTECNYGLTDFFNYLYNLENTSELGFSEEVSDFLACIYNLLEEY